MSTSVSDTVADDSSSEAPRYNVMTLRRVRSMRAAAERPDADADAGGVGLHAAAKRCAAVEGGIEDLLTSMRDRHLAYAAMHTAAARSCEVRHRNLTVAVILVSFMASVATNAMTGQDLEWWSSLIINVGSALVVGFTAVNNLLGYQKREEQHIQAKHEHMRGADLISTALAFAGEGRGGGDRYDFEVVLEEIQDIHDTLKKTAIALPKWVAQMYPQYEAPWLVAENAGQP